MDVVLFRVINTWSGPDWLWAFFTFIGNAGAIWVALAGGLVLGAGRLPGLSGAGHARWRAVGVAIFMALALGWGAESLIKVLVGRPRPPLSLDDVRVIGVLPHSMSFPSGHSLSSFAVASVLAAAGASTRADRFVPWMLAALIAFSRIYVGHHYPLDVLAGALLGMIIGRAVWSAVARLFGRSARPSQH